MTPDQLTLLRTIEAAPLTGAERITAVWENLIALLKAGYVKPDLRSDCCGVQYSTTKRGRDYLEAKRDR